MFNVIILGAGMGTRMKSSLSKVMHKIAGKPMLKIVYDIALKFAPKATIIVASSENANDIEIITKQKPTIQYERLGTGHAVLSALPFLKNHDQTFILYGDTPLILAETLEKMTKVKNADIVILGFYGDLNERYGRLICKDDEVLKIVEDKDATPDEKKNNLYNSGIFLIKTDVLRNFVPKIQNDNNAKEFYFTDIIKLTQAENLKTKFILTDKTEVLGVNNREELSVAEFIIQERLRKLHMENGVTLQDPKSVFFNLDTEIESDVEIEPNVVFNSGVKIKKDCVIKSFSYLAEVEVESGVHIGPFARIRGKTKIGSKSKIGNFVEVKNSTLASDVKAGHLAYIGDAQIASNVNVGAGAVFCNFDGIKKHITKIGKNAFIGSNSSLVAPIEIGENAFVGAGSVITSNVENDTLAIERTHQKSIPKKK